MKRVAYLAVVLFLLTGCSAGSNEITTSLTAEQTVPVTTAAPTHTTSWAVPEFEAMMVVDNDQCAIYIRELWEDPVWGWSMRVELENKSDTKTYMYAVSSASINDVQAEPLFAIEVAPGKKAREVLHVRDASLEDQNIGLYSDVELHFRVYDTDDWTAQPVATPSIHVYPYGAKNAERFIRQPQPGDMVLANDEGVTVTAIDFMQDPIWGYTTKLFLENNTEKNLLFTVENASVNGYMADPLFAKTVNAGNCAFGGISWSNHVLEELEITEVESLEFVLRVYDAEDWSQGDIINTTVAISPK